MRRSSPPDKQDDLNGLRTRNQIDLFIEREKARSARVGRREAEARVREAEARIRHLSLDLITRIVLLILAVGIGISLIVGLQNNPAMLKLAVAGAGAWGAVAAALSRLLRPAPNDLPK